MTRLGYPSRVTEAWVKGKTWFRVQHGEYKMIAVAKQVSIKLKNKYKFNPWISNIYKIIQNTFFKINNIKIERFKI